MNPQARSGVACMVLPWGWWDPPASGGGSCDFQSAPWRAGEHCWWVRGRTPLACSWDASLAVLQSGLGQLGGKGSGVLEFWGSGARQSGPARGEHGDAAVLQPEGKGSQKQRETQLVFHQPNCKSSKLLPWAGSTFLRATGAAGAWAVGLEPGQCPRDVTPPSSTHSPWGATVSPALSGFTSPISTTHRLGTHRTPSTGVLGTLRCHRHPSIPVVTSLIFGMETGWDTCTMQPLTLHPP